MNHLSHTKKSALLTVFILSLFAFQMLSSVSANGEIANSSQLNEEENPFGLLFNQDREYYFKAYIDMCNVSIDEYMEWYNSVPEQNQIKEDGFVNAMYSYYNGEISIDEMNILIEYSCNTAAYFSHVFTTQTDSSLSGTIVLTKSGTDSFSGNYYYTLTDSNGNIYTKSFSSRTQVFSTFTYIFGSSVPFIGSGIFTIWQEWKTRTGSYQWFSYPIGISISDDDDEAPTVVLTDLTIGIPYLGTQFTFSVTDVSIIPPSNSGITSWTINVYKNDDFTTAINTYSGTGTVVLNTYDLTGYGHYDIQASATDGDNDRTGDAKTGTDSLVINIEKDTSAPTISLGHADIPFVGATVNFIIEDQQTNIASWFCEVKKSTDGITYNQIWYESGGASTLPVTRNGVTDSNYNFNGFGNYTVHIEATNKHGVTGSDDDKFTVLQTDVTSPEIIIETTDLTALGVQVSISVYDLDTIFNPSGISSWSYTVTNTLTDEVVKSGGQTFSSAKIEPIIETFTISTYGTYNISVYATNGVGLPNFESQIFEVNDWTAPVITFENAVAQTDANPLVVSAIVTDAESGLKQVIVLFGFDLDVLENLNIDMSVILESLIGATGIDVSAILGDDMIWIPISITNIDVINLFFNAMIESLFGEYLAQQITPLLEDFINTLLIENLAEDVVNWIAENLGEQIASILESVGIFADNLIEQIIEGIRGFVIDLLLDDSFVQGQTTYTKSIDMKYFGWLRLFGNFQLAMFAQNMEDDIPVLFTISGAVSPLYSFTDDDTTLSVSNFVIYGNEENIIIQFNENDASGIAFILTIDNIPVPPQLYTATKVGDLWTIEIAHCWLDVVAGEGFHTATLYIMDLDSDWLVPYLFDAEFGSFDLTFELSDPEISYEYTGDGTDANAGSIIFSITDDSEYTISGQLVNNLEVQIDTPQTFSITAIDMFGNKECKSVTIQLEDDDSTVDITDLTADTTYEYVTIQFTDVDYSGIASLSNLMVDGNLIGEYTLSVDGNVWTVTMPFTWAINFDVHTATFDLSDSDNDRMGDSATDSFSVTFQLTEQDIVDWADAELEELITMCSECNCWQKKNYQATMINKINEVIALKESGQYAEAYSKLIHDVSPKLTGMKVNGNPDFKNAWVCESAFASFSAQISPIAEAIGLLF